jgi:CYTH domain-containing protein
MTIVRRFLLPPSFVRLVFRERGSAQVSEGYFATQTGRNSYILLEAGECYLVLVTPDGEGAPIEERTAVPRAHADALLDVCSGSTVYARSRLSIGEGREGLIDRITVPGQLDMVSVEFESRDEASSFLSPPWFGPEVTLEPSYDRRSIALTGVPAKDAVPISSEGLDALLDHLEDGSSHSFVPTTVRPSGMNTIDALRRFAEPEAVPARTPSTAAEPSLPDAAEVSARPRRNFPFFNREQEEANGNANARVDEVLAGLAQALATPAPVAAEAAQAPQSEERPARRRRFGT